MKMKIEFEFDYFENREEYMMLLKASSAFSVLHDIDQLCRSRLKYEEPEADESRILEEIRGICFELTESLL